ncbi:MAG: Sec-independent protein translocase protein TatB [Emcibacteraceae bacterium]|nr:Sec-independent protein translocase protein TatB [Emcibacteraceae bacterium]MDG1996714.1 Sec-independent protein translocase protein TatB [Emcibacteraceae bacterium]
MFDVGFPELFIVAVLAIIVVGPKDLPKVIRSVMGAIKKVREMGGEFQAGVKKMADEVELEAVTRKLNEAGNVKLDDKPAPAADSSAEFSDYAEFDYDEYDYEGRNYEPPAKPTIKEPEEEIADEDTRAEDEVVGAEEQTEEPEPAPSPEVTEEVVEAAPEEQKDVKSKTDV